MARPRNISAIGKIDSNGNLKIFNRDSFIENLKKLESCEVTILVTRKVKIRSNKQMGYYFGCVVPMIRDGLKEIGYLWNNDKVDKFLREGFFYNEVVNPQTGTIIKEPISLKEADGEISTTRMEECLEEIRMWASQELSISIPLPNEQVVMFSENYYENEK